MPISIIAHDPAVLRRIAGLGLGGRHAPQPAGAGLADERVPRPLPQRVRLGDVGGVMSVLGRRAARTPVAVLPPQRLAGLDGVRGLAALFVVVNHVFLRAFPGYPVDRAPFWAGWFIYGRFAVVVFIVLSGFSLALSPARHGWRLDGVSPVRAPAGLAHPAGVLGRPRLQPRGGVAGRRRRRGRERPTRSRSSSTACWCRTSSARRAPTGRSGRSPSRPSSTSCSRCCC